MCFLENIFLKKAPSLHTASNIKLGESLWSLKVKLAIDIINSSGASMVQLQFGINCLSKEERHEILKEANLPITIPSNHVLAMKADLALYPGFSTAILSTLLLLLNKCKQY